MDAASHYRQLVQLGREEFLASAAPAALVRNRGDFDDSPASGVLTLTLESDGEDTMSHGPDGLIHSLNLEIYPLIKKPGASFPDRITIGRTSNNDIVVGDTSVSRLHAYLRRDGAQWVVADAGSKNGSWLDGQLLVARKERAIAALGDLRLGDIHLRFYAAEDLYKALGGL